jgi:cytochrome c-type biogenesis protein CcmH/NrfG
MRGVIREQLQQGRTREEVLAFFVSKYGEWVLLTPKPTGFNLLVYVVPFLGAAAGLAGVLVALRRWVRRRRQRAEATPEVSAADQERLRRALEAEEEVESPVGAAEAGGPLAELEAQRAALYGAIRELEFDHRAGMLSQGDYEPMRRRYEAEAVALLHRLDALGVGAPSAKAVGLAAPVPAGPAKPGEREEEGDAREDDEAAARGFRQNLWIAGGAAALVAFAVLAGAALMRSIGPRPEGGSITGGPLTGTESEMPAMGPAAPTEPGQTPLPLDPATVGRMLRAARAALEGGKASEAAAAYRAVLERQPRNVEAITGLGTILERSGELDLALHVYDKALEIEPRSPQALWTKGNLLFQRADYAGALKAWQAVFEAVPPGPDRDYVEQRMADARARLTISGPVPPPPPKAAGAALPAQPR